MATHALKTGTSKLAFRRRPPSPSSSATPTAPGPRKPLQLPEPEERTYAYSMLNSYCTNVRDKTAWTCAVWSLGRPAPDAGLGEGVPRTLTHSVRARLDFESTSSQAGSVGVRFDRGLREMRGGSAECGVWTAGRMTRCVPTPRLGIARVPYAIVRPIDGAPLLGDNGVRAVARIWAEFEEACGRTHAARLGQLTRPSCGCGEGSCAPMQGRLWTPFDMLGCLDGVAALFWPRGGIVEMF
ncbi:hypothetical protein C8Q77DRAFT_923065 [Trametes polyzona]|nr:hypothetical protein C8Q77DRAFT_923065 [Trametes polyzona]